MSAPSPPSITAAIARWVLGHRRLVIGLIAVVTVLAIVGATRIGLSFSSRDFFATSDDGAQAAADLEALTQRWGPDDATLLVLAEADDVTTAERVAALSRLSHALAELPTVVRTLSIADVPASVRRAPPIVPALISEAGDATIVAVQLSVSSDDLGAVVPIVDAVNEIVERHRGEAGLTLTPAGVPAVRAAFFSLAIRDQAMLGPLVSLTVAVVLFVAFRRRHAVVVPMLAAGLPLVWLLGCMGAAGEPIGLINQAFFTLLPVIAIADAVHWVVRVHDEWRAAPDDRDGGIVRAGAGVGMACTLTSLTTAAGFVTLVAVDVEILRRFGTWAAIGIGLAWLSVVVVMPLALSLVVAAPSDPGAGRGRAVARWSMEHPALVSVLAVGLLAAAGHAGEGLAVDNRLTDLLPAAHPVRRASDRIDDDLGGILALEVELAGVQDTELAALADWARTQPEVRWVGSGQAAGAAWQRQDGIARISIHTPDVGGRAFAALAERVRQHASTIEGATVVVTGTPLVAYTGVNRIATRLRSSLVGLLLVVTVVVGLALQSVRLAVVAVPVNVLPLLVGGASLAWLGQTLDPLAAVIVAVALGIAVDDTLHLMARTLEELRAGRSVDEAVLTAAEHSGRALVVTTVALAAGLSVQLLSSFPPLRLLGGLGTIIVVVALVADLTLLPALLGYSLRRR